MAELFKSIFAYTFQHVIDFIYEMLERESVYLEEIVIKFGFGNVEWVNTNLYDLLYLIGTITISVVFLALVWKVFKFFTKLVNRAFGGRKW